MVVTGVQGPDMLFEISVVNLLSVDFDFANALPVIFQKGVLTVFSFTRPKADDIIFLECWIPRC